MFYSEKIFENEFILELDSKNYPNMKLYKEWETYPYNYKSYGEICTCSHLEIDERTKNIFDKFDLKIFGEGLCNENVIDIDDKDYFVDNKEFYCKSGEDYVIYNYMTYTLLDGNYPVNVTVSNDLIYIQFKNKKDLVKFKLMIS